MLLIRDCTDFMFSSRKHETQCSAILLLPSPKPDSDSHSSSQTWLQFWFRLDLVVKFKIIMSSSDQKSSTQMECEFWPRSMTWHLTLIRISDPSSDIYTAKIFNFLSENTSNFHVQIKVLSTLNMRLRCWCHHIKCDELCLQDISCSRSLPQISVDNSRDLDVSYNLSSACSLNSEILNLVLITKNLPQTISLALKLQLCIVRNFEWNSLSNALGKVPMATSPLQ